MKKAPAPEIRMTEAALKRQAKIKLDKEQSDKPTSAGVSGIPQRRPLSTRARPAPTSSVTKTTEIRRGAAKKAKIEENSPTLVRRVKAREPLRSASTVNKAPNRERLVPVPRPKKSPTVDYVARSKALEGRIRSLEEELKDANGKLARADLLVTVAYPNVIRQQEERSQELLDAATDQIARLTAETAINKVVEEEKRELLIREHQSIIGGLNRRLQQQEAHLISLTKSLANTGTQLSVAAEEHQRQARDIDERDRIIADFPNRLEEITKENEKRISQAVDERIIPYKEAKSLANSMKFEVEEKARQNKCFRETNNSLVLENENLREENDKLDKFKHMAEDRFHVIDNVKSENRRLHIEVEAVRQRLSTVEKEKQLLNCSLDEEKYRTNTGEHRLSTSFRSVYDENESNDESNVFYSFNGTAAE